MKNEKRYILLLGSMYLAGILGLSISSSRTIFQWLTPFHLITVSTFLVFFQKPKNTAFWTFTFICMISGYLIEVCGVNTGLIFGEYQYLSTLGPKLFNAPPLIGLNWFLMIYCTGYFVEKSFSSNLYLKGFIGAGLMTIFDIFAEPVAISHKMWIWQNDYPPIQNYVAWFIISFVLILYFLKSNFPKSNRISNFILAFQWIFFVSLFILEVFK